MTILNIMVSLSKLFDNLLNLITKLAIVELSTKRCQPCHPHNTHLPRAPCDSPLRTLPRGLPMIAALSRARSDAFTSRVARVHFAVADRARLRNAVNQTWLFAATNYHAESRRRWSGAAF